MQEYVEGNEFDQSQQRRYVRPIRTSAPVTPEEPKLKIVLPPELQKININLMNTNKNNNNGDGSCANEGAQLFHNGE